jgi:hypothetical protein
VRQCQSAFAKGFGAANQELRYGWGVILQVVGAQGVENTSFKNSAETARKKCNFEMTLA